MNTMTSQPWVPFEGDARGWRANGRRNGPSLCKQSWLFSLRFFLFAARMLSCPPSCFKNDCLAEPSIGCAIRIESDRMPKKAGIGQAYIWPMESSNEPTHLSHFIALDGTQQPQGLNQPHTDPSITTVPIFDSEHFHSESHSLTMQPCYTFVQLYSNFLDCTHFLDWHSGRDAPQVTSLTWK